MTPPQSLSDAATAIRQAVASASGPNATISHDEALMRISTDQLERVLHDSFEDQAKMFSPRGWVHPQEQRWEALFSTQTTR